MEDQAFKHRAGLPSTLLRHLNICMIYEFLCLQNTFLITYKESNIQQKVLMSLSI